jgi:hypothetical protein
MTTPITMNDLISEIRERFQSARSHAMESENIAPGSWGLAYDLGYSDALSELLEYINKEIS